MTYLLACSFKISVISIKIAQCIVSNNSYMQQYEHNALLSNSYQGYQGASWQISIFNMLMIRCTILATKLYFSRQLMISYTSCNPHGWTPLGFRAYPPHQVKIFFFPIGSPGWDAASDETPSEWEVPSFHVFGFESLICCKKHKQAVTISIGKQTWCYSNIDTSVCRLHWQNPKVWRIIHPKPYYFINSC